MQTPDRTTHPSGELAPGAAAVIEGASAEAALAEVHERFGPDARVVDARRVLRGGIGGFFAREVVQIHVAAGDPSPTARPGVPPPAAPVAEDDASRDAADGPAGHPIDRLLADADDAPEDVDFATFLRAQLGRNEDGGSATTTGAVGASDLGVQPIAWPQVAWSEDERPVWADQGSVGAAAPGEPATDPVPSPDQPTSVASLGDPAADATRTDEISPAGAAAEATADGGPAWSATALIRLGLPADFVRGLAAAGPADDLGWTVALTEALRPMCGPLPAGRAVLVGPRARGLAARIGLRIVPVGAPVRVLGDVAAAVRGGRAAREWLATLTQQRWLHLVAGGSGWRELLHAEPLAVSWATTDDLADALRCAIELGLTLGYGPQGGRVDRARPFDVALTIRALLPED